jgi:DNA adenine methylase
MRSPIAWFGGKGNMTSKLIPILNSVEHRFYCEPFGGGGSVLLAKPPAEVETYNDLDSALYDFFTVIADPDTFQQFYRRVEALPYSRQLYYEYRDNWRDEGDRIKRVAMWFIVARQNFGGHFSSGWGSVVTESTRGRAHIVNNWQQALHRLPEVHARLQRVQIENKPAVDCIAQYDTPDTLFYCDPPYILDTRSAGGYTHEMTDEQHEELIDILLQVDGAVVLSGYNHPIYARLHDHGFDRIDYQTASHVAGRTRNSKLQDEGSALKHAGRVESVWVKQSTLRQKRLL